MQVSSAVSQLRTTNLAESIRFYTTRVGLRLEFQYQDLLRRHSGGESALSPETRRRAAADALKRNGVRLVKDVHETAWGTREFVIKDDQGHTVYFGEKGR